MPTLPRFETLETTLLVGKSLQMSRVQDQTAGLWREFMPSRDRVEKRLSEGFISLQVYPQGPQQIADPAALFTKWALVEVADFESVPEGMDSFTLEGGLYAVFDHQGPATDLSTVMFIFGDWLQQAPYVLDDRPHFERLPVDYQPLDPNAREEFWIPVQAK